MLEKVFEKGAFGMCSMHVFTFLWQIESNKTNLRYFIRFLCESEKAPPTQQYCQVASSVLYC